MQIDRKYQLWRVTAPSGDPRPTLQHIQIANHELAAKLHVGLPTGANGLALATNGLVLAIVPVSLEDSDIPGLLDVQILKDAAKATPKTLDPIIHLDNVTSRVTLFDGSTRLRTRGVNFDAHYPDVSGVVPSRRPGTGEDLPKGPLFPLNVALLADLAQAIGFSFIKSKKDEARIRLLLTYSRGGTPVVVEPIVEPTAAWLAPFGLLMGLHDGSLNDGYYEHGLPRARGGWEV